jgi:hypothetical protein
LLAHPVDGVGAGFAIANQFKKAVADQQITRRRVALKKQPVFDCRLAAPDDNPVSPGSR